MRTLQIKFNSFDQLQEFNSIACSLFNRSTDQLEDYIEYFNLKDLLKKIADVVYRYSNRRAKKIPFSIEINQYKSLCNLYLINIEILHDPAMIYHRLLLNVVIEQGKVCFETKYPVVIVPPATDLKQLA